MRLRTFPLPKHSPKTRPSLPHSLLPPLVTRHQSTISSRPLKIAIVGAGPSGFYSASRILSSLPPSSPNGRDAQLHMYERLPTPYGLVRYGVAPDHPEVKVRAYPLPPTPPCLSLALRCFSLHPSPVHPTGFQYLRRRGKWATANDPR